MTKRLFIWMLAFLLSPAVACAAADEAPYTAGVDYKLISPPQNTSVPKGHIEVIEMFWYGCPHCHRFIPYVDRWLKTKPANVDFQLMPAVLRNEWEVHARFFYAEQALGLEDKLHIKLFDAIHKKESISHNEGGPLFDEDSLLDFVAKQGVDRKQFADAMHSFGVMAKVNRAKDMGLRYGVHGTPSIIVNGKYMIEAGMNGADFNQMLKVVNYLVKKEQAGG
jgi:thiol:disulfide interchange protein DsbA